MKRQTIHKNGHYFFQKSPINWKSEGCDQRLKRNYNHWPTFNSIEISRRYKKIIYMVRREFNVLYNCHFKINWIWVQLYLLLLQSQFSAAPVAALCVPFNGIVRAHTDPLRQWSILSLLFCQGALSAKGFLRRLRKRKKNKWVRLNSCFQNKAHTPAFISMRGQRGKMYLSRRLP